MQAKGGNASAGGPGTGWEENAGLQGMARIFTERKMRFLLGLKTDFGDSMRKGKEPSDVDNRICL